MRRTTLAGAAGLGLIAGATLFNDPPARAVGGVGDVVSDPQLYAVMGAVQGAVTSVINKMSDALVNKIADMANLLGDRLSQGFTQLSNYSKAQVGAEEQVVDASNIAMARFQRDLRNAQIMDEHTPSPNACAALDGGVAAQAAAVQGYAVASTIAAIHDQRGAAGRGMPSYEGTSQGAASMAQLHLRSYCNQMDVDAGLCSAVSATPDAEQRASSLWSAGAYADQAAVNAAKDFATLLIQPVAPAPLRGDMLASHAGEEAAVRRRAYNARMSLATSYVDRGIGMQVPSVPLSPTQQAWLQAQGLPAAETGSWLQVLQIESERRVGDVTWNANLEAAPPAAVVREGVRQQALTNFLLFQVLRDGLQRGAIAAAQLGEQVERHHDGAVRMPNPDFQ